MMARNVARRPLAFTLLELVAVIGILVILAALLVPNFGRIMAAAQEAVCASKMRSIKLALDGYLQDHRLEWPQGPTPTDPGWASFWLTTLAPYGISERTWQCPTIKLMVQGQELPAGQPQLHYVPTLFDATPNIAHRWSTQPWLIEVANAHGKGALICFPDGSVKPFDKVLAEQGVR
jgi:type II secretory pathway pseudopilin PulG